MTIAVALVRAAACELEVREQHYPEQIAAKKRTADEAGRSLAAWRAIVALLNARETAVEACLGPEPKDAWPALLEAIDLAIEHRTKQCTVDGGGPGERLKSLREVRSMLIRSASRQGVSVHPAPLEGSSRMQRR